MMGTFEFFCLLLGTAFVVNIQAQVQGGAKYGDKFANVEASAGCVKAKGETGEGSANAEVGVACEKEGEEPKGSNKGEETIPEATESPEPDTSKCGNADEEIIEDCDCGHSGFNESDYTHETTTDTTKHPWLVSVFQPKAKNPWGICSGVLLKLKYVITTAQCVHGLSNKDTKVKGQNGCEIKIEKITRRPDYHKNKKIHNDFAILKLERPFNCTKHTSSICFPRNEYHFGEENTTMHTAGFVRDGLIQEGTVKIIDADACGEESDVSRFCTEDRDKTICHGGFGGPGMQFRPADGDWRIVGLASGNPQGERCSWGENTPFTKIGRYWNFIKENTK